MSKMESILEDILTDAVESYVEENLTGIIADICRLASEEGKSLPQALDAVVFDWLEAGDGYVYIRDDMERQAENSCDYEYDCEKIIFEYGFTRSLDAAKEAGIRLSNTDESEVAAAVLKISLPEYREIREMVEVQVVNSDEYQKLVDEVLKTAKEQDREQDREQERAGGNRS